MASITVMTSQQTESAAVHRDGIARPCSDKQVVEQWPSECSVQGRCSGESGEGGAVGGRWGGESEERVQ